MTRAINIGIVIVLAEENRFTEVLPIEFCVNPAGISLSATPNTYV